MINHHAFLQSFLDKTLTSEYKGKEYQVNFTEGDIFELWKKQLNEKRKYPVIWLQSGYKVIHDVRGNNIGLRNMRFLFITKGSVNDFNEKRFTDTFNEILFPLYSAFIDKIRKTQGVRFADNDYSFVSLPFNDLTEISTRVRDYGNKVTTQTTTSSDIWDAIILDINLDLDPHCVNIKPFKT